MKPHNKLKSGDFIGIVAPASPVDPKRLKAGLNNLAVRGFIPVVAGKPEKFYGKDKYLFSADSAEVRAKQLHMLFQDKRVKAIIAARGAYGSVEILPYLDFKLIKKHPKPLIGFSDITTLLNVILAKSGIVTIHGPMLTGALADEHQSTPAKLSVDGLFNLLSGELANPFEGIPLTNLGRSKEGVGILMGGSISTLLSLIGTPYQPNFTKKILFLEEIGEKPYRIHKMLMQFKLAGLLDKLSGVILGSFVNCGHSAGPTFEQVIKDIFSDYKIPVLAHIPAGHHDLNLPLPLGVKASINRGKLDIVSPVVL